MDPEWEKSLLKDLYGMGVKIAKKYSSQLYFLYLESLFDINPAGFLEYDIRMPVKIRIKIDKSEKIQIREHKIKKLIGSSRFFEDENSKFSLYLKYSDKMIAFKLTDKNGALLYSENIRIEKPDKNNFKKAINDLVKNIFTFKL